MTIGKVKSDIRKFKSIRQEDADHRKIWSKYRIGRDKEYDLLELKLNGSASDLNLLFEFIMAHETAFTGLEYLN